MFLNVSGVADNDSRRRVCVLIPRTWTKGFSVWLSVLRSWGHPGSRCPALDAITSVLITVNRGRKTWRRRQSGDQAGLEWCSCAVECQQPHRWKSKARVLWTSGEGVALPIPWFLPSDAKWGFLISRTEREHLSIVLSHPYSSHRNTPTLGFFTCFEAHDQIFILKLFPFSLDLPFACRSRSSIGI